MLLFVLPSSIALIYFFVIASDQYSAETRFTLGGGMPPKLDTIGALTGLPSGLVMQDTQIILNYLLSRAIVERLDHSIGLRKLYSDDSIDPLSRFNAGAPVEKLQSYWKAHIDFSVHMPGSIVTLKVWAFSRQDAVKITDAIIVACEELVNSMNERTIHDTVDLSETERERAFSSFASARSFLEVARNTEGMLSADNAAESLNELLTRARGQLGVLEQEFNAQKRYVSQDAPQLRTLLARIEATQVVIKSLESHLTAGEALEGSPLTKSMSRLDYLNLENNVAEKIYSSSLVLFEHARLAAESRILYLNVFVRPFLPDRADFRHRNSGFIWFLFINLTVYFTFIFLLNVWVKQSLFGFSVKKPVGV